jgi:hypothetical protein
MEELDVDEMMILRVLPKETECECVDWIHLVQDRFQWRAVVNTLM